MAAWSVRVYRRVLAPLVLLAACGASDITIGQLTDITIGQLTGKEGTAAAAAPPPPPPQSTDSVHTTIQLDVVFAEQRLGLDFLKFGDAFIVGTVDARAAHAGVGPAVQTGDAIVAVAGVPSAGLSTEELIRTVQSAPRPVNISLARTAFHPLARGIACSPSARLFKGGGIDSTECQHRCAADGRCRFYTTGPPQGDTQPACELFAACQCHRGSAGAATETHMKAVTRCRARPPAAPARGCWWRCGRRAASSATCTTSACRCCWR